MAQALDGFMRLSKGGIVNHCLVRHLYSAPALEKTLLVCAPRKSAAEAMSTYSTACQLREPRTRAWARVGARSPDPCSEYSLGRRAQLSRTKTVHCALIVYAVVRPTGFAPSLCNLGLGVSNFEALTRCD